MIQSLPCMHSCSVSTVVSNSLQPKGPSPPGSSVHGILQAQKRYLKFFTSLDIYFFFRWFKGPLSGPDSSPSLKSDRQTSGRCPTITPTSEVLVNWLSETLFMDFSGGPVVKNPPDSAGDTGLIPGL